MIISGLSASTRALRQPVYPTEPTDLSTRAADEAKQQRLGAVSGSGAWPASGFWHCSRLMMQGSTNRSSADDSGLTGLLCATNALQASVSSVAETANSDLSVAPNPDSWRVEVAARLERYRTRRKPRTPRYPSLLLPFDAPESWSRSVPTVGSGSLTMGTDSAEHRFTGHTFALEDPIALGTR